MLVANRRANDGDDPKRPPKRSHDSPLIHESTSSSESETDSNGNKKKKKKRAKRQGEKSRENARRVSRDSANQNYNYNMSPPASSSSFVCSFVKANGLDRLMQKVRRENNKLEIQRAREEQRISEDEDPTFSPRRPNKPPKKKNGK